jgi:hypothetical protein
MNSKQRRKEKRDLDKNYHKVRLQYAREWIGLIGLIKLRKWLGGLVNILGVIVVCKKMSGLAVHSIS